MQHITNQDFSLKNSAVALGKFEGLHRGHQLLFHKINEQKEKGFHSVVFTFDMPPGKLLKNDNSYKQIYTRAERYNILKDLGTDILIEHPFTPEFASLTPERFIKEVLVEKVDAKVIVVGTDFRFGKKRAGSVEDLKKYALECGYELIVIDKLQIDSKDVSSTYVRELLADGRMEQAALLLGRNFSVSGEVIHGKALGRTIDIPTANILIEDHKLTPPNGVYVSKIEINHEIYYGISNVGVKPTVSDSRFLTLETHIFDYNLEIYGTMITVELLHYCRPEMKFQSVLELKEQMDHDILFGREYVSKFN